MVNIVNIPFIKSEQHGQYCRIYTADYMITIVNMP